MDTLEAARVELAAARTAWLEQGRLMSTTPVPPVWRWRELSIGEFFQQRAAAFEAAQKRLAAAQEAVHRLTLGVRQA